jgi:ubiquinone/menaquinone biosynthesis C-methylase UbiE
MPNGQTAVVRRLYDRYAFRYDRDTAFYDQFMLGDAREWACEPAWGQVLELAIGTGRNLPCYRPGAELVGVDISRNMLNIARVRAQRLGAPARLIHADGHALPFASDSYEMVVCTLGLSSIPDPKTAIAEVFRVLRPGGTLRIVGHGPSPHRAVAALQRLLERQSVKLTGDRQTRPTLQFLTAAGFIIDQRHRSRLGIIERVVARKPGNGTKTPTSPSAADTSMPG